MVRQLRVEARLSQEEPAEKAHVHRAFVSTLERARQSPTLDVVEALAHVLGKDPQRARQAGGTGELFASQRLDRRC